MLEQMMKMLEGQQINSYRLNKFLGAGGFGGVFHASERGDPRPPYQGGIKGGSAPPLSSYPLVGSFLTKREET
jgi:hypothetical protein